MFIVYSASGLSVTVPSATFIIYNNTVTALIQWTPFDKTTGNATLDFINQNTMKMYPSVALNNGTAHVNIAALGLPPGTYNVSVSSALGYGQSSMFVVRDILNLTILLPNATTNVSNVGLLDIDWVEANPAGGNVTIYMYGIENNITVVHDPFSTADDGSTILNLSGGMINKSGLEDAYFQQNAKTAVYEFAVRGFLVPKRSKKIRQLLKVRVIKFNKRLNPSVYRRNICAINFLKFY